MCLTAIKNRLIMLANVCDDSLLAELMDWVSSKSAVLEIVTGRYKPKLEDVDYTAAVEARVQFAYREANRHVTITPAAGTAANKTSLRLDRILLNTILDNLLSNVRPLPCADKY